MATVRRCRLHSDEACEDGRCYVVSFPSDGCVHKVFVVPLCSPSSQAEIFLVAVRRLSEAGLNVRAEASGVFKSLFGCTTKPVHRLLKSVDMSKFVAHMELAEVGKAVQRLTRPPPEPRLCHLTFSPWPEHCCTGSLVSIACGVSPAPAFFHPLVVRPECPSGALSFDPPAVTLSAAEPSAAVLMSAQCAGVHSVLFAVDGVNARDVARPAASEVVVQTHCEAAVQSAVDSLFLLRDAETASDGGGGSVFQEGCALLLHSGVPLATLVDVLREMAARALFDLLFATLEGLPPGLLDDACNEEYHGVPLCHLAAATGQTHLLARLARCPSLHPRTLACCVPAALAVGAPDAAGPAIDALARAAGPAAAAGGGYFAGATALSWAVERGLFPTALRLVALGADVNSQNPEGETPLFQCIDAVGRAEEEAPLFQCKPGKAEGDTPLSQCTDAAGKAEGDPPLFQCVDAVGKGAETPASGEHAAEGRGVGGITVQHQERLSVAKAILDTCRVEWTGAAGRSNRKALLTVSKLCLLDVVQAMLVAGCPVDGRCCTPLLAAISSPQHLRDRTRVIELLAGRSAADGALDCHSPGEHALTPLQAACLAADETTVAILLSEGASLAFESEAKENSVHCVLRSKAEPADAARLLRKLLKLSKAACDRRDANGFTPLHLACGALDGVTRFEAVERLTSFGYGLKLDNRGLSPLHHHLACGEADEYIAGLLLDGVPKTAAGVALLAPEKAKTVLVPCVQKGMLATVRRLCRDFAAAGDDAWILGAAEDGNGPLVCALLYPYGTHPMADEDRRLGEAMALVLTATPGCPLDAVSGSAGQLTPFHLAVSRCYLRVVERFLSEPFAGMYTACSPYGALLCLPPFHERRVFSEPEAPEARITQKKAFSMLLASRCDVNQPIGATVAAEDRCSASLPGPRAGLLLHVLSKQCRADLLGQLVQTEQLSWLYEENRDNVKHPMLLVLSSDGLPDDKRLCLHLLLTRCASELAKDAALLLEVLRLVVWQGHACVLWKLFGLKRIASQSFLPKGITLLQLAFLADLPEEPLVAVCHALIAAGVPLNNRGAAECGTALQEAIKRAAWPVVQAMLTADNGIDASLTTNYDKRPPCMLALQQVENHPVEATECIVGMLDSGSVTELGDSDRILADWCCRKGLASTIRPLHQRGFLKKSATDGTSTLAHHAVSGGPEVRRGQLRFGAAATLEALTERGYLLHMLEAVDRKGNTPLVKGLLKGAHEACVALLRLGASTATTRASMGFQVLAAPRISDAAAMKCLAALYRYSQQARDSKQPDGNKTLLHVACKRSFRDVVNFLLNVKLHDPNSIDDRGRTPLLEALAADGSKEAKVSLVRCLLHHASIQPLLGQSPMHFLFQSGVQVDPPTVRALLDSDSHSESIAQATRYGESVLVAVCRWLVASASTTSPSSEAAYETFEAVCQGSKLKKVFEQQSTAALHVLLQHLGCEAVAKAATRLILHFGASCDAEDEFGLLPVQHCLKAFREEAVQSASLRLLDLLMDRLPDRLLVDTEGRTLLHLAFDVAGDSGVDVVKIAQKLLSRVSRLYHSHDINAVDSGGVSALTKLVTSDLPQEAKRELILELMQCPDLDLNMTAVPGTVLHYVVTHESTAVLEKCLQSRAAVAYLAKPAFWNVVDEHRRSVLHCVFHRADADNAHVVENLLAVLLRPSDLVDLTLVDSTLQTPFLHAVHMRHWQAAKQIYDVWFQQSALVENGTAAITRLHPSGSSGLHMIIESIPSAEAALRWTENLSRLFAAQGKSLDSFADAAGDTLLHAAAARHFAGVCQLLMREHGCNPFRVSAGRSPLHACLTAAGARPREKNESIHEGTPCQPIPPRSRHQGSQQFACSGACRAVAAGAADDSELCPCCWGKGLHEEADHPFQCARALLGERQPTEAEANTRDRHGVSLLMLAARSGDAFLVKRLLESGASVSLRDGSGWSSLHYAAAGDQPVERLARALQQGGGGGGGAPRRGSEFDEARDAVFSALLDAWRLEEGGPRSGVLDASILLAVATRGTERSLDVVRSLVADADEWGGVAGGDVPAVVLRIVEHIASGGGEGCAGVVHRAAVLIAGRRGGKPLPGLELLPGVDAYGLARALARFRGSHAVAAWLDAACGAAAGESPHRDVFRRYAAAAPRARQPRSLPAHASPPPGLRRASESDEARGLVAAFLRERPDVLRGSRTAANRFFARFLAEENKQNVEGLQSARPAGSSEAQKVIPPVRPTDAYPESVRSPFSRNSHDGSREAPLGFTGFLAEEIKEVPTRPADASPESVRSPSPNSDDGSRELPLGELLALPPTALVLCITCRGRRGEALRAGVLRLLAVPGSRAARIALRGVVEVCVAFCLRGLLHELLAELPGAVRACCDEALVGSVLERGSAVAVESVLGFWRKASGSRHAGPLQQTDERSAPTGGRSSQPKLVRSCSDGLGPNRSSKFARQTAHPSSCAPPQAAAPSGGHAWPPDAESHFGNEPPNSAERPANSQVGDAGGENIEGAFVDGRDASAGLLGQTLLTHAAFDAFFRRGAQEQDPAIVETLLSHRAPLTEQAILFLMTNDMLGHRNALGDNVLHLIALHGQVELLDSLLQIVPRQLLGELDPHAKNVFGKTPICYSGNVELQKALVNFNSRRARTPSMKVRLAREPGSRRRAPQYVIFKSNAPRDEAKKRPQAPFCQSPAPPSAPSPEPSTRCATPCSRGLSHVLEAPVSRRPLSAEPAEPSAGFEGVRPLLRCARKRRVSSQKAVAKTRDQFHVASVATWASKVRPERRWKESDLTGKRITSNRLPAGAASAFVRTSHRLAL
ncbi:hypothetical protein DIPPA_11526 [Diplonema papillatum]|nr:hypothetical protein DIPPA_11526 [Diplonema papillatum]